MPPPPNSGPLAPRADRFVSRSETTTSLPFHHNPHAAGGPLDHPLGVVEVAGVEHVGLLLADLLDLGPGHFTDLLLVRHAGALRYAGLELEQGGRGRALGDEVERAVAIDRDHDGDRDAVVLAGPFVELRDELAQVDAEFAERGA